MRDLHYKGVRYSPLNFFKNIGILYSTNTDADNLDVLGEPLFQKGYTYAALRVEVAEYYNKLDNKLYALLYYYAASLHGDEDVKEKQKKDIPNWLKHTTAVPITTVRSTDWREKLENIYSFIRNNEEEALEWFKQENSFEFYYLLGLLYKDGKGFKQDYSKALDAFKLALRTEIKSNGNFNSVYDGFKEWKYFAMFELGEFYFNGWGTPANYEEAAKWYRQILENK